MAINQRMYEQSSVFLVNAVEDAQLTMIRASASGLDMLSHNPQAMLEFAQSTNRAATKAGKALVRKGKVWATKEVPKSYLQGIQHANEELKPRKLKISFSDKSLDSPLLPQARLTTGVSIGAGVPKGFEHFPKHLNMVNIFKRNAAEASAQMGIQLVRGAQDVIRDVNQLVATKAFNEASVFTRRKMSQTLAEKLAKKGIGSVAYANGRNVPLDSYAEMVGRTMSGRAAVTGSLARYQEMGVDLVQVSGHFRTCDLCAPWEGKILSQSGSSDKYPPLQVAIESGLLHPNCAHDIGPYVPGFKQPKPRAHPMEKKIGRRAAMKAQSQQRHIERKVREWKRRLAADMKIPLPKNPAALASKAKVRAWQSKMRVHLKKNPFLPRKYYREQLLRTKAVIPPRPSGLVQRLAAQKKFSTKPGTLGEFFDTTFRANFSAGLTDAQILARAQAKFPTKKVLSLKDIAKRRTRWNRVSGLDKSLTQFGLSGGRKIEKKLVSFPKPKLPKKSKFVRKPGWIKLL